MVAQEEPETWPFDKNVAHDHRSRADPETWRLVVPLNAGPIFALAAASNVKWANEWGLQERVGTSSLSASVI